MASHFRPDSLLSLRRTRLHPAMRELTREVRVSSSQLIQPLFVVEGLRERESIPGLSDVYRDTPVSLLKQVENDLEKGVRKFLLFGVPKTKSTARVGKKDSEFDFQFTVEQIKGLKARFGKDIFLIVDVCLCSSTAHGHCGVLDEQGEEIKNGVSVEQLKNAAVSYAQAGVDCVAPSDMMDGRIGAIRHSLDSLHLDQTLIMSYSAKFQSRFYGPFRVAADSSPKGEGILKDRSSYQIDPARPTDAYLSSLRDANEGADILMVKPGLPYLDVLYQLSREIKKPWAVYEVSGEYAAIELMAEKGLAHGPRAHLEAWTAFVRAGATMIITYGARQGREWIAAGE